MDDVEDDFNDGYDNEFDEYDEEIEEEEEEEEEEMEGYAYPIGPMPQEVTNDLRSLDEMVRDMVEECQCPSQFAMIRVAEGKYRIGETKVLIFVRILRSHVMVRVGGGWDTLQNYLDKHDPCRCRRGHRSTVGTAHIMGRGTNKSPMATGVHYDRHELIFGVRKTSDPVYRYMDTLRWTESPATRRRSSGVPPSLASSSRQGSFVGQYARQWGSPDTRSPAVSSTPRGSLSGAGRPPVPRPRPRPRHPAQAELGLAPRPGQQRDQPR